MIQTDLSNIWGAVSLPDLLDGEKDLFDAHLQIQSDCADGPSFLEFLGSEKALSQTLQTAGAAADAVRACSDTLVVLGTGGISLGVQAALSLLPPALRTGKNAPLRVLFYGSTLSEDSFLCLCDELEKQRFSILLLAPAMEQMEVCLASRALRWMAERRFGTEARQHVFVAAPEGSPMSLMAQEEGFSLLPLSCPSGLESVLNAAALTVLDAAGVNIRAFAEGAAQAARDYDLRAFENPLWMYAGARRALEQKGKSGELLCSFCPEADAFGLWWQQLFLRRTCREGVGLLPLRGLYPAGLDGFESALSHRGSPFFETFLQFSSAATRTVNVEMDWKDYDGLGYLSGKTLRDVRTAFSQALAQTHAELDIPMILLSVPGRGERELGGLFYFFELSAALCAVFSGLFPFELCPSEVRECAAQLLGKPQT